MILRIIIVILILTSTALNGPIASSYENDIPSLKDVFQKNFLIGSGDIRTDKYFDERYFEFIKKHYNTLNINTFYPSDIHSKEKVYKWNESDEIVDFAEKNKLFIRGQVLIWHKEEPGVQWMFIDRTGKTLSKDVVLEKMKEHIQTIVSRYKGRVWAWDVVNEAVDISEQDKLKSCMLKDIIGSDYVEKAFIFAHEADPDAKLFYNDFSVSVPEKRQAIYDLLKSFIDKKIPVHGIGMQMHLGLNIPNILEIEKTIELYSKLGLDIHITELDIDMNPIGKMPLLTEDMKVKQAERYKELFDLFKKYDSFIKAVYTFGIDDSKTWLKTYNEEKRENWPLLFDEKLNAKSAFWSIVKQ